jgi:hypothetical protein
MSKNSKYRKLLSRLPEEMKELMASLKEDCYILDYLSGSMGWKVDFSVQEKKFSLVYDRGYFSIYLNEENFYPKPDESLYSYSPRSYAKAINQFLTKLK